MNAQCTGMRQKSCTGIKKANAQNERERGETEEGGEMTGKRRVDGGKGRDNGEKEEREMRGTLREAQRAELNGRASCQAEGEGAAEAQSAMRQAASC